MTMSELSNLIIEHFLLNNNIFEFIYNYEIDKIAIYFNKSKDNNCKSVIYNHKLKKFIIIINGSIGNIINSVNYFTNKNISYYLEPTDIIGIESKKNREKV